MAKKQVSIPGGTPATQVLGDAPGYVTVSPFWTSPSTYVTISSYILPVLALIFHRDFSAQAKVIVDAAPGIATVVLLVMRQLHRNAVIKANTHLATLQYDAEVRATAGEAIAKFDADTRDLERQFAALHERVMGLESAPALLNQA